MSLHHSMYPYSPLHHHTAVSCEQKREFHAWHPSQLFINYSYESNKNLRSFQSSYLNMLD